MPFSCPQFPQWTLIVLFCWTLDITRQEILDFDLILPDNPRDYDNMQPPKENGNPTVVEFHVTVLSIDTIDEGSMTYVADIFMSQSWKDHRLRLPENTTSKYRLLPLSWLKRMWRPDSFFKNAKKVTFQEMTIPNHYIWLYSDKTILYMVKLTLLLSCAMKFEAYPHDTQVCNMKIESLSYTTDDLVFEWEKEVPLVVDPLIELPQHNLVESVLGDCTQVYSTGNFTCIQVVFTLKRRLGYYMFHTYIPTCLIVIMSWISFWIKPEAVPARVTLCVTSLLTLSTQHAQSQKALPPVSYIKAIDIFMSSCTVFVFASLMEYALVNILLGESADLEDGTVKKGLRNVLVSTRIAFGSLPVNSFCAEPIDVRTEEETPMHTTDLSEKEQSLMNPGGPGGINPSGMNSRGALNGSRTRVYPIGAMRCRNRAILVDKVSRVAFPLSFVVLNGVYWAYYTMALVTEARTEVMIFWPNLGSFRRQWRRFRLYPRIGKPVLVVSLVVSVILKSPLAKCHSGTLTFGDILPEDSNTYDKMRPPKKDGEPTKVRFHVTVMGLDSINEGSMTYAADIFFAQTWKDHRLRFPENMTSEYRLLEVDWLKNMWRPDSFFKNAKQVTFQTMTIPNHYVWLYRDKTILYMVKLTLVLSCAMNFATYPHDTQQCSMQMESLSHTTDDLIFDWEEDTPLMVDDHIELPQLDLVRTDRADCTQVYSTGNFTCLMVTFNLRRRLGYYLFHTYIPTCLIVIMSWVSFWIKPEAVPARVTLGVTSLLTLATQHARSQSSLPPVSYIKAIDIFMSFCTIFVFSSLMEYAVVNVVLEDSDNQGTGKKPKENNTRIYNLQPKLGVPSAAQVRRRRALLIDKFSRVLFPMTFAILNVAYWIYYVAYK